MAKPRFYRKKAVISGNQIELREHEFPVVYGFEGSRGGRKPGISGSSQRSAEYRKRSTNRAKHDLIRLINANFMCSGNGWVNSNSYKFITLTFREGSIPDLTDVKQAYIEFKKYARKLRAACLKQGRDLKYVVVIEFQDGNGRGAVHFHMIAEIPVIPVTREVANTWRHIGKLHRDYNVKLNHYDLWGHGAVTVKAIVNLDHSFQTSSMIGTSDIGQHLAAYMVKDFGDSRLRGNKAYSCSHGLQKPHVVYDEQAEQAVKGLGKENVVCEGSYPDTHHNSKVQYTKYNKLKKE